MGSATSKGTRHYDTIVVGAGSAGATIAARATEASDRTLLLVEAGPDYPPKTAIPADLTDGGRNSLRAHDWGFVHRRAAKRRPFPLPRGRVVGGSSAVNTCIALRGQRYDYDEWGLDDWRFERCIDAFRRLEDDRDCDDEWHGRGGPIPIRRHAPEELVPWQAAFLEACEVRGLLRCADLNHPDSTGASATPMNKIDGHRISAAAGYLTTEVRSRDNFELSADTLVRRILFDGRSVVGIEVEHQRQVEVIHTNRVMLCAGAIGTPSILLRSGVGPKRELERIGVGVVAEVDGVGAQLLDHPGTAIFFRPRRGGLVRGAPLIQTTMRYASKTVGRTNDMQIQPGSIVPLPRLELPLMSLMASVGKPRSRGTIRLLSADPRAKPTIESNLFTDEDDLADAVEALRILFDLASTKPLRTLGTLLMPRAKTFANDDALARWIRFACDSGYHPCGTVRMGTDEDLTAATDARGRVRRTEGLFVADASLMPTVPSSNINIPTLMIGERFGAWLRDDDL